MKQKLLSFIVLCSLLIGVAHAQNQTVTGRVTSASDGTPISGVSVSVVGSNVATQTNAQGDYSISAPANGSLSFSYLGYTTQRVQISGRSTINVVLQDDTESIGEVVVTAMGIQRSVRSLAYATSQVDTEDILQNSEPDVLKSMQGKVAGVDIRSSQGTPGSATRFNIRGNTSFMGDSQPLIIVDGVPYDNSMVETSSMTSGGSAYSSGISNLDPNDIESFNVLKGSAAASLYGSRGANGVVIITTKSGSTKLDQPTAVTFRSSISMEDIANLPTYQNSFGTGSQLSFSHANGSWGPNFNSLDSVPTFSPYRAAYPDLFGPMMAYQAFPNNVRDLFKTGRVLENSVNFQGGSTNSGFNVTLSQMDHEGYVPNSTFKRYNVSAGGNLKVSEKFSVRASLAFTNSNQVGGYFGENQVDGAASQFARSLFLGRNWDTSLPWETPTGGDLNWLGGGQFDHPTWSAHNNFATTMENRILTSATMDYQILDWWKVDYTLGANLSFMDRKERYELTSRAYEGLGGLVTDQRNHKELEQTLKTTLTPYIDDDFSFIGVLGFNYNQRITERMINEGRRFIAEGIYTLPNMAQPIFNTDNTYKRRIMGFFADATFGYRDYLYLTLSARNDISSTLPVEARSYFYPGVSSTFIFSDALNIQSDIFSYGKLRAAWAKVGRDTDPYMLQNVYSIGNNFLSQPTGSISTTSRNPVLTPEFTNEYEFGTELAFLNSRITLDATYYNRTSTDLLASVGVPVSSGYNQYFTNFGKINNEGVEIALGVRPLAPTSEVQWRFSAAFTKNKNIVQELIEGTDRTSLRGILSGTISTYLEPGEPFGYLRGTRSLRDDEGNLLINPATGALIEDQSQEYNLGDPNPQFRLGISNTVSYKGFNLSALFDWTQGGSIYSVTNSSLLGRGVTKDTEQREFSAIIPGVYGNPNTGEPILDGNGNKLPNQTKITVNDLYFSPNATVGQTFAINTASEWNVYDATVFRLREIALGYDLPQTLFNNTFIKGLYVSVTGRNLWHFAPNFPKHTNFDPEVNSFGSSTTQGIDLSAAPTTKRYGFNLVARF